MIRCYVRMRNVFLKDAFLNVNKCMHSCSCTTKEPAAFFASRFYDPSFMTDFFAGTYELIRSSVS